MNNVSLWNVFLRYSLHRHFRLLTRQSLRASSVAVKMNIYIAYILIYIDCIIITLASWTDLQNSFPRKFPSKRDREWTCCYIFETDCYLQRAYTKTAVMFHFYDTLLSVICKIIFISLLSIHLILLLVCHQLWGVLRFLDFSYDRAPVHKREITGVILHVLWLPNNRIKVQLTIKSVTLCV